MARAIAFAHATDVDGAADALAACPPMDGSACNAVASLGTPVLTSCSTSPAPTMTGGALADGNYVLTSDVLYLSSPYEPSCAAVGLPTGGPSTWTVRIADNCFESVSTTEEAGIATANSNFSVDGNLLELVETCPASGMTTYPFTATATSLTVLVPWTIGLVEMQTFTLQGEGG
ncbi:MAG: hypothetical protein ABSC94_08110 [Polyangiaceae bacterium]